MSTRKRSDLLIRDVAQLFLKYSSNDWRPLIEQLSKGSDAQIRISDAIQALLMESAKVKAQTRRSPAKSRVKKSRLVVRVEKSKVVQDNASLSPDYSSERSEALIGLGRLLVERRILTSASNLRQLFLNTGGKGELPKSRGSAVLVILRHLDSVPDLIFNEALKAIQEVSGASNPDDAYARWFNLIRPPRPPALRE